MNMRCKLSTIRGWIGVLACGTTFCASAFTYTNNTDLLLALYKSPYKDMVFNLGSVSNFFNLPNGTVVTVTNFNAAVAKANFNNNLAQVSFALMAITPPGSPINAGKRRTWVTSSAGTPTDLYSGFQSSQYTVINQVGTLSTSVSSQIMPGVVTNYVAVSAGDASYGSFAYTVIVSPSASLGGQCAFTVEQTVPGTAGFFELKAVTNPNGPFPASTQLGSFSLALDGTLTFTAGVSGTPPSVTTGPSGATVVLGGSTNFSVVASGTQPLSYSWRRNSNELSSFNATLSLNNVQLAQAGYYDVVVSNAYGMVTSAPVSLRVLVAPTASHRVSYNAGNVSVPISNSVNGLVYTLQYRTNAAKGSWIDVPSSLTGNGTTLTLQDASSQDTSRFYRVRVD